MYAIVRTGGHQHRVAVGDTLEVNRLSAAPGESITLGVRRLDDRVSMTVADSGGGIDDGDLERIFDRFARSTASRYVTILRATAIVARFTLPFSLALS